MPVIARTVEVDVEVYPEDVLGQLSIDELIDEVERRAGGLEKLIELISRRDERRMRHMRFALESAFAGERIITGSDWHRWVEWARQ